MFYLVDESDTIIIVMCTCGAAVSRAYFSPSGSGTRKQLVENMKLSNFSCRQTDFLLHVKKCVHDAGLHRTIIDVSERSLAVELRDSALGNKFSVFDKTV